ncbi:MAG: septum formation initiator family protein [Clostridiales bacterium]|nr:septum formation initiator family protein [Clostridiales bacterium]
MKKSKKIYKKLIILAIATYVIFTLVSQQKTLNQYENQNQKLTEQIAQEKESKEELAKKKEDVNSLEFIEQTAREKLDMYYPNEKVYMDQGM